MKKNCHAKLEAAVALGCEAFIVDAGWYGQSEGTWWAQVGDWREKTDGAFLQIKYVRKGLFLVFGLNRNVLDQTRQLSKNIRNGFIRVKTVILEIMDRLRECYPKTIIENCAGGALRFDIEHLKHFDISFISDNVNPYDLLRIAEGAALRILPGRYHALVLFQKWRNRPEIR